MFWTPLARRMLRATERMRAHVRDALSRFAIDDATTRRVYRSDDRDAVVVEFGIGGRMLATGAPFRLECVSIVETKGGLITRCREYWNPLAVGG